MNNFSVLIAVYGKDNARFFAESMASIFDQTLMPTEVVLVEDGPLTEALRVVVSDYQRKHGDRLRVVSLPENGGLGKALNAGLAECSYEWVARMDSDDLCKKNRFECQMQVITEHPDLSVVGSWVDEFTEHPDKILSQRKLPESNEELVQYFRRRCPMNHPTVMFKKSDVLAVGGYPPVYLLEDYYLWGRLIAMGYRLYNIQESLLFFRVQDDLFAHRRGGWEYGRVERELFGQFLDWGLITHREYLLNVSLRTVLRTMPISWRKIIYRYFLR